MLSASLNKPFPSFLFEVAEKDRELGEWKSRYHEMTDTHKEARKKLDQLELYLGGLPTAESVAHTEMEISFVYLALVTAVLLSRGAGRSSEVERSLMVRWVVGSILHGVDPLSYFSF